MAKSNDQPNRTEINEMVVEVLKPEVSKLSSFMRFTVSYADVRNYIMCYLADSNSTVLRRSPSSVPSGKAT